MKWVTLCLVIFGVMAIAQDPGRSCLHYFNASSRYAKLYDSDGTFVSVVDLGNFRDYTISEDGKCQRQSAVPLSSDDHEAKYFPVFLHGEYMGEGHRAMCAKAVYRYDTPFRCIANFAEFYFSSKENNEDSSS